MSKVELLSPAGNMYALKAAVAAGCDAVYFGGKMQNARMAADNFDDQQIGEAISFAKLRGVKAYVAMNTLNFGDDIEQSVKYAIMLEQMGADAIILQDLGLMKLIGQQTKLPLHASTQCGVSNVDGVLAMKELGMDRVILAREMPLDNISNITKNTDMEIEVFVHGALCSSFSGQCYLSWNKGGRSGNCGSCAQPCRLPYENGHVLSTRDLCAIELLPELIRTGVCSLKIEGRLKRPEYVSTVTRCYRQALDLVLSGRFYDPEKYKKELMKIYNRGGFTTGYYGVEKDIYGGSTPSHQGELIGVVKKVEPTKIHADVSQKLRVYDGLSFGNKEIGMEISDLYYHDLNRVHEAIGEVSFSSILKGVSAGDDIYRTTDYLQIQLARQITDEFTYTRWMQGICTINRNEAKLEIESNGIQVEYVLDSRPERAKTKSISKGDVSVQLEKTGNTVFKFDYLEVNVESGLFLSTKDLNKMRRETIALLQAQIVGAPIKKNNYKLEDVKSIEKLPDSIVISSKVNGGEVKIFRPKVYDESAFEKEGFDGIVLPHITYDVDLEYIKQLVRHDTIVICNNIGQVFALKDKCNVYAGFGLNVVNEKAAEVLYELGAKVVMQNYEQEKVIKNTVRLKRGKVPMMNFAICPNETAVGCDKCSGKINGLTLYCQRVINKTAVLLTDLSRNTGQVIIED